MKHYTVENFTADISVDEYIRGYRDAGRFIELCRQCPNYGNSWGCPPFDFDTEAFLRQYKYARLMVAKVVPLEQGIPIGRTQEFIRPERMRIESGLLEMERLYGGRAFAYIGKCLHCTGVCTRRCGKPCLHPDKVRPSLEAFGFDISLTVRNLFGLELLWSTDGTIPAYLLLVSAFFHNCEGTKVI